MIDDLDVPEDVRVVVRARLRRLGEDGARVLGGAAVLGRTFSFESLQVIEEVPEDRLLDYLEQAERAGLIAALADDPEDRFVFGHELIRQTVLSELSSARRRRLHARAADALERVYAANVEPRAATIARHLLEAGAAGDPKRTFHYLFMAGRWAQESAAFEEALIHLGRAGERAERATRPNERNCCIASARPAEHGPVGRGGGNLDAGRRRLRAWATRKRRRGSARRRRTLWVGRRAGRRRWQSGSAASTLSATG